MVSRERIKKIRALRRLTQRELGLKSGYEERNVDVRTARYESGYRVPKNNTLMEMAKILDIRWQAGSTSSGGWCRRKKNSLELSAALYYLLDRKRRPS